MTLEDLRKDIDRVDEVLVRLLNERARCVCEIGRLKKQISMDVYQPDREKQVLQHVRAIASEREIRWRCRRACPSSTDTEFNGLKAMGPAAFSVRCE